MKTEISAPAAGAASQTPRLLRRFSKIRAIARKQRHAVKQMLKKAPVVRLVDKASFVGGVLNMIATEAILFTYPSYFWIWYSIVIPVLMAIRYVLYWRGSWGYFLYDYCYYIMTSMLLNVHFFPLSEAFFKMNFIGANGPLAWAIVTWRCSTVFHSLDKMSSLVIHIFPCFLTFCWRYYPSSFGPQFDCDKVPGQCSITWGEWAAFGIGNYLLWQVSYFLKVYVRDAAKLKATNNQWTSIKWFSERMGSNPLTVISRYIAGRLGVLEKDEPFNPYQLKTQIIFMSAQFGYSVVTMLPTMLFYRSWLSHFAFLLFLVCFSVWNGSGYYIEVFVREYQKQYENLIAAEEASKAKDETPGTSPERLLAEASPEAPRDSKSD